MVLGFNKITFLKLEIINLLERQTTYISSSYLTEKLQLSSQSTIKKICQELQCDIQKLYTPEQFEMIINQRYGIKLIRQDHINNLKLIEFIITNDLAYEIIQELCLKRTINTTQFCLDKHVSLSQLRRKIKEINYTFNKINLHISIATNMKITGNESRIRTLFFGILFFVHRKITNLTWLSSKFEYREQTQKIFDYLELKINNAYLEIITISYYINSYSISNNYTLDQEINNNPYFQKIKIKEKPIFLAHWSDCEWKFMLLSIFIFDPSTMESTIELDSLREMSAPKNASLWIEAFENEFSTITETQKRLIDFRFYKHLIAKQVMQIDDFILETLHQFDYEFIGKSYPLYLKKFNQAWQVFSKYADNYFLSDYFKSECLVLSFTLLPQQTYFPKVKLFLYTEHTQPFNTYIEDQIKTYFCNRFSLEFVQNQNTAQIIISTEDGLNLLPLSEIPIVSINLNVFKKDLIKIEKQLVATVENDCIK